MLSQSNVEQKVTGQKVTTDIFRQIHVGPKKNICVFTVTCQKNLGSALIFFFITIGKTGNSRARFWNPIPVIHFRNFW